MKVPEAESRRVAHAAKWARRGILALVIGLCLLNFALLVLLLIR